MSRLILVDDTSPLIQYEGSSWFLDSTGSQDPKGNYGPTFNKTLHGTISTASFSLSYNGSGISVFGTNNLRNDSGVLDPQWQCFVDGVQLHSNPFSFFENNWSLCNAGPTGIAIADGPHVLTVNVTVQRSQAFWLDRIQYRASADVLLNDKVILVENSDADIQYDANWAPWGGNANITSQTGSTATFSFDGISLSWFGYIPSNRPHGASSGTYSIDGNTPTSFILAGLPNANSATLYNQEFFKTPVLSPGRHNLDVVFLGNGNTTPLVLDYLVIQNRTSAGDQTSPAGNRVSSSSSSNLGAIVGGVLGGLVVVLGSLVVVFFFHQKRKQQRKGESVLRQNDTVTNATGNERVAKPQHSGTPSFHNPGASYSTAAQFLPSSKLTRYQDPAQHTPELPGLSSGPDNARAPVRSVQSTRHTHSASEAGYQPEIVVHEDSGIRNVSLPQPPRIEVPPTYTP